MSDIPHLKAASGGWILHYTDADGFKAISSQQTWVFKAGPQRGEHPFGAYFTRLLPSDNKLSAGTRLPVAKRQYVLAFIGEDGLTPVRGGKGDYNLWTDVDYSVTPDRQRHAGLSEQLP